MRTLVFTLLLLCAAAQTGLADMKKGVRDAAGSIGDLSSRLFLHEAESAYADGDYSEARSRFTLLAERGISEAQLALGVMYEEGQGVLHDYEAAFEYYESAATQGLAEAQLRLARMYYFGRNVRPDKVRAYAWTAVAADQGNETALRNRDRIARQLNDHQLISAQSLADQWIEEYNRP